MKANKENGTVGQLKWDFAAEASEGEDEGILIAEDTEQDVLRTKLRTDKERHDLRNRLRRIEGQVRGLQKMLERDAYCTDILIQVAAVTAALNSFSKMLLTEHVYSDLAEDIRAGKNESLDELLFIMCKMMK